MSPRLAQVSGGHNLLCGGLSRTLGQTLLCVPMGKGRAGPVPTINDAIDAALLEGHDVLGEGAGLVREDVLHLAQLVGEAGVAGLGGPVLRPVVHLQVPVDEDAVSQVYELGSANRRWSRPSPLPHRGARLGRAGRWPPRTHRMNMAMGTMTLSRMRKAQKTRKTSVGKLYTRFSAM